MNSNPLRTLRHHRQFRRLWFSAVVSDIGTWMQAVTVTVLVATTSKSATDTALVYSSLFLPQAVCAPLGGLLADRFDRRRMAMTVLVIQAALAGVLAVLISRGLTSALGLAAFVGVQGCANAIGQPAYAAMIPQLVPQSDLYPAVSLGAVSWNAGRILGPLLAAVTASAWSPSATITANAISFLVMVGVLWTIKQPLTGGGHVDLRKVRSELVTGAKLMWRTPTLRLMLLSVALLQATFPTMFSLVPLYAKAVGGGRHLPQVLYTAIGLGAMSVALSVSALARHYGRARLLGFLMLGGATMMIVAAQLHGAVPATIAAFGFGATATPGFVLIGGVVQREAPEAFRGRITSIHAAAVGLVFGVMAPLSGWLADAVWGLRTQMIVSGGLLAAVVVAALLWRPQWAGLVNGSDPVPVRQELREARATAA